MRNQNFEMVVTLLDAGADINHPRRDGRSVLEYAASEGLDTIVKVLLDAEADNERVVLRPKRAFIIEADAITEQRAAAREFRYDAEAGLLYASGARDDIEVPRFEVPEDNDKALDDVERHWQDSPSVAALKAAIDEGHFNVVRCLVEHAADLHLVLHHVAKNAKLSTTSGMMRYLISKGADPAEVDHQGCSALHRLSESHVDCVELLVDSGAKVAARNGLGYTPFMMAVRDARISVAQQLLAYDADHLGLKIQCALQSMARDASPRSKKKWQLSVDILLRAGAVINCKDEEGRTAVHSAALFGAAKFLEALAERGADLNTKTGRGKTALAIAKRRLARLAIGLHDVNWRYSDHQHREYAMRRHGMMEGVQQIIDFLVRQGAADENDFVECERIKETG
ncbi:uncharacterized protein RHO25_004210 [Cercospora beticola]|uniref:Ankyrin repeat protein n=2 Tax=Cercospora beticola TaxID=122368 RepID=A0ABZ0NJB0_CERBT|nr:hypothetical protein RHO25_004210 [Cercospora beticola]